MAKSITECLREVGEEQITLTINGEEYTCTKTEAVARKMFLLAQGGTEVVADEDGNGVTVMHKPDYKVAKMLREFTEGKAAVEVVPEGDKKHKAGRYDSSISKRLNDRLGSKPSRPMIPKGENVT